MTTVLSIGTTHPWNIAGVGLDLRIGAELNVAVLTVVCAVSAQDAHTLRALEPVSVATVEAQLAAIPWEAIDAVRVGALGSAGASHAVARAIGQRAIPAVVDPVVATTHGEPLAGEATLEAIREALLPLHNVILTPNLREAEMLLGRAIEREEITAAAQELHARGARAVLLKGGHLQGDPADALADAGGVELLTAARIGGDMRGTGCTLAMALACALARGDALRDAVRFARGFVREKIAQANP
ncbi:MAG TPA: PfkB family carbohydrate kinase [Candidatus Acidoferrales bacterium]|nr:PfkB family carbohydrate kinase [Candidatus Acidoferrales bacterium]